MSLLWPSIQVETQLNLKNQIAYVLNKVFFVGVALCIIGAVLLYFTESVGVSLFLGGTIVLIAFYIIGRFIV